MRRAIGLVLLAVMVGCSTPERGVRRGDEGLASRAGYPNEVSRLAHPSDTGRYIGYEVGGGSPNLRKGGPPTREDGTWGWDYPGYWWPGRIALGWWHGRRYQGGLEGYKTDGPRPIQAIVERHEE